MRRSLGYPHCYGSRATVDALVHLRAILLAIPTFRKLLSKNLEPDPAERAGRAPDGGLRGLSGFDIGSPRLEAGNLLHFGENKAPGHSTSLSLYSCNVAGEARGFPCILDDADGSVAVGHATNDLVSST